MNPHCIKLTHGHNQDSIVVSSSKMQKPTFEATPIDVRFVAFEVSQSDEMLGEGLPRAAVVRFDAEIYRRFHECLTLCESLGMDAAQLKIQAESIRWLSVVCYTENPEPSGPPVLAPINGWMEGVDCDRCIPMGDLAQPEIDDETVCMGSASVVYASETEPVEQQYLVVRELPSTFHRFDERVKNNRHMNVSVGGDTPNWNIGGFMFYPTDIHLENEERSIFFGYQPAKPFARAISAMVEHAHSVSDNADAYSAVTRAITAGLQASPELQEKEGVLAIARALDFTYVDIAPGGKALDASSAAPGM